MDSCSVAAHAQASDGSGGGITVGARSDSGPGGGSRDSDAVEQPGGEGSSRDQGPTDNPLGGSEQEAAGQLAGDGSLRAGKDAGGDDEDLKLIQANERDRVEHPERYQALYMGGDRGRLGRFMFVPRSPEEITSDPPGDFSMQRKTYFAGGRSLAVQYARKVANCRGEDGKAAVLVVWVAREKLEDMVTTISGLDWQKVITGDIR